MATFEVKNDTLIPRDLKLHFIPIDQTYYWNSIPTNISHIPMRTVEVSKFGLVDLTPSNIKQFKLLLEGDAVLTFNYLVAKLGYDPENPEEYEDAMSLYIHDSNIVSDQERAYYKFICLMHRNKTKEELETCLAYYESLTLKSKNFLTE
jgi:hypothetical protein